MSLNFVNIKYFKMLNSNVKGTNSDLCVKCHICGDSKTKNKQRLHLFNKNSKTDTIHCFNCGYSSSAYLYFKEFHPDYFEQYRNELKAQKLSTLKDISLTEIQDSKEIKEKEIPMEFSEFKKYFRDLTPEATEYLYSRNFSNTDIEFMKVLSGRDEEINLFNKTLNFNNFVILPIFTRDNKVFGFQARHIKEKKYYTIILDNYEKLWGLHTLKDKNEIYAFESIFDAVSSGFESVLAVMGISSSLNLLEKYKPIVFYDNQYQDLASLKMCKSLAKAGYNIVLWDENIKAKDVNDLLQLTTKENIKTIARNNTFNGLEAYVRLSQIKDFDGK